MIKKLLIEIGNGLIYPGMKIMGLIYLNLQNHSQPFTNKGILSLFLFQKWHNNLQIIQKCLTYKNSKKTGQKIWDTPVSGRLFEESCKILIKNGFSIKWIDKIPAVKQCDSNLSAYSKQETDSKELLYLYNKPPIVVVNTYQSKEIKIVAKAKRKYKYACNLCGNILCGKYGVKAFCIDCNAIFLES